MHTRSAWPWELTKGGWEQSELKRHATGRRPSAHTLASIMPKRKKQQQPGKEQVAKGLLKRQKTESRQEAEAELRSFVPDLTTADWEVGLVSALLLLPRHQGS